jgi:hypothetical protein
VGIYGIRPIFMKFEIFFEDLLQEAKGRPMSDKKFEAISQNIGRWIYNYFVERPAQLSRIPFFSEFREFARKYEAPGESVNDIEQLVLMIKPDADGANLMYDYLNQIPNILKAQEIIRKIGETFEPIGTRIKYYDRPDDYVPVRGRKPKERSDKDIDVIDITKTSVAPSEPKEPGRRGRKPSVVTLEKMQTKYYKMYDDLEKQLRAMKELSSKINDYKNYFGK